jgi:hypothetical protein
MTLARKIGEMLPKHNLNADQMSGSAHRYAGFDTEKRNSRAKCSLSSPYSRLRATNIGFVSKTGTFAASPLDNSFLFAYLPKSLCFARCFVRSGEEEMAWPGEQVRTERRDEKVQRKCVIVCV